MEKDWIVVVDDDPMSLKTARTLLNEQNMKASCVRSGSELLTFLDKNEPDLILLDIMMPEMDGFETYGRIRDLEEQTGRVKTPIIFLTGENDSDKERRGLRMGASDFMHKPFNKDILLRRIKNAITNARTIENLRTEVYVDPLTGFFNKAGAAERLTELCENETGIFMILDLDNFKLVNDLYGHEMGDKVLEAFASVFRRDTRDEDTVCRIGGDEFAAFLINHPELESPPILINRLNDQFEAKCKKLMGESFNLPIGISAGAVFVPEHGRDYQILSKLADKALYKAKQNGKHNCVIYSADRSFSLSELDLSGELSRIMQVLNERGENDGALELGQEAFTWIYRFMVRFVERYNTSALKVLFKISVEGPDSKDALLEASGMFSDLLKRVLRKSDIYMQTRADLFFAFLPEASKENAESVLGRIMREWNKINLRENVRISYNTEGLDCTIMADHKNES